MSDKMELCKYLVNNRANGVDHYELWEENPDEAGHTEIHQNRPTTGDGLFFICEVSLVVDEEHYGLIERLAEAISVKGEELPV